MAYASYEFYQNTYKGSAIPAAAFDEMAERASEYLDADTGGKAAIAAGGALEAVRRSCCAVAEVLYADRLRAAEGTPEGAVLKAETVSTWRQEYELTSDATKTLAVRVYDIEKRFLGPWGLLYRGVRPCVH